MAELCTSYSGTEIILFLVILACAVKGVVSFLDWAIDRINKIYKKEFGKISEKRRIEERLDKGSEVMETLSHNQNQFVEAMTNLSQRVDLLIDSDKDDIKAFLTDKHHYFCHRGWIDDYSLECCERRFSHYIAEGGNSFIEGFMNEMRALPKQPPLDK